MKEFDNYLNEKKKGRGKGIYKYGTLEIKG